jgi:hypothetical protein
LFTSCMGCICARYQLYWLLAGNGICRCAASSGPYGNLHSSTWCHIVFVWASSLFVVWVCVFFLLFVLYI